MAYSYPPWNAPAPPPRHPAPAYPQYRPPPPHGYEAYGQPRYDQPHGPRPKRPAQNYQANYLGLAGKRPRMEKNPDASTVFFCETCDRSFQSLTEFTKHNSEHQKCPHAGCGYCAHPKLVRNHVNQQHRNGQASPATFWNMTPQDIDKWKAERRKNFPTKANVEKKQQLMQEKIARGEVVENKFFGKMRGRGRGRGQGRGRGRGQGRGQGRWQNQPPQNEQQQQPEQQHQAPQAPPRFQGDPLAMLAGGKDSDEDDKPKAPETGKLPGALGLLGADYGTNSESEGEEATPTAKQQTPAQASYQPVSQSSTAQTEREDSRWGSRPNRQRRRRRGKDRGDEYKPSGDSLLEKLLANEIRQERNMILQCVRYVVQQNFFGITPAKEKTRVEKDTKTSAKKSDDKEMGKEKAKMDKTEKNTEASTSKKETDAKTETVNKSSTEEEVKDPVEQENITEKQIDSSVEKEDKDTGTTEEEGEDSTEKDTENSVGNDSESREGEQVGTSHDSDVEIWDGDGVL